MTAAPLRPHEPGPGDLVTNQDLDPEALRTAFGIFPSGVVAVAAEVGGRVVGLAASSFTSVSLEPPLVSVNLARTSQTWPHLRRAPHLGVTVLAGHHAAVCRQLAGPSEARFEGVDHVVDEDGAVFLPDGLAQFDCTVEREVEAGDHVLVLLRLHALRHAEHHETGDPLVFHRSTVARRLAPGSSGG